MADNTCHFGINSFFADNGLSDVESFLYFPADALQMTKIVQKVFFQRGIRFVSVVPSSPHFQLVDLPPQLAFRPVPKSHSS